MRRSVCYCDPNIALAGKTSNWKFIYTTASTLPKGAKLRFDLNSKGRPIDWQVPETDLKAKKNVIWAQMPDESIVEATEVMHPQNLTQSFEFILPEDLKPTQSFFIFMGTPTADPLVEGNAAQKIIQRKRLFPLMIDPKGKGEFKDSEIFHLDVRGNDLTNLKVLAPSLIGRNKRFDLVVRFEDRYGNLTSCAPEGTLIELSYEHLRENLNWKLFVPETGFITLPNLYFNEAGIYRIQLKNLKTAETFFSAPIKCINEDSLSLYWGSLHGESERTDAKENIETFLRHMRDDKALHFVATSPFDAEEETSSDIWKKISQQVAELNEDERFVAFLGFQWLGDPKEEGMRQFIYTKDSKPLLRKKDTKSNSLKKIFKTSSPKDFIAIPSFTMGKKTAYNFEDFNSEFEKVVEIYNAWGSSECSDQEGNLRPIEGGKDGIKGIVEGSIQKALNAGCRFGFIAGGYDDRGPYDGLYQSEQKQYAAGITAILAKEHTRASLIDALHKRSCYATTGARIVLGLSIAGFGMGKEVSAEERPGLAFNRHITGYCIGTKDLKEVILFRNGLPLETFTPTGNQLDFAIDDSEALDKVALSGPMHPNPFVYYYFRAVQKDGHIAWSSPVWIDLPESASAPKKKKKST